MTEASENAYLVRVRAQVMTRDETTGGWVAVTGGGLAHVMVGRRPPLPAPAATGESNGDTTSSSTTAPSHEYYIYGRRISDDKEVLECTIKKDFQYNKVMPTFHHWVTGEKRFGLTFQTAADARAFDKGVRTAVEELLDGLGGAWPSLHAYKQHNPAPREEDEEQNIFECLNLPSDSRSSSENSTASRARRRDLAQTPILHSITLPHRHADSLKDFDSQHEDRIDESASYVQLSAIHDYTYPQVGPGAVISSEKSSPNTKPPLLKRDSGSIKKCGYSDPPPLPHKKATDSFQQRLKCRHCHEWYYEAANNASACEYAPDCCKPCVDAVTCVKCAQEWYYEVANNASACEYAPDCCKPCVDAVTCVKCAQCMLYHCMSDAEGDFAAHPFACCPTDASCCKRWVGITLLSLVVPCLWCYFPVRCAHRAARAAALAPHPHEPIPR